MTDTKIGIEEDGIQKSVHPYWGEITKIKTATGQMGFPSLAHVIVAILSLPHSNADCESAFSGKCIQSITFTAQAQQRQIVLRVYYIRGYGGSSKTCHTRVEYAALEKCQV